MSFLAIRDVCALFSPQCEHILSEYAQDGRAILSKCEREKGDVCAQTP